MDTYKYMTEQVANYLTARNIEYSVSGGAFIVSPPVLPIGAFLAVDKDAPRIGYMYRLPIIIEESKTDDILAALGAINDDLFFGKFYLKNEPEGGYIYFDEYITAITGEVDSDELMFLIESGTQAVEHYSPRLIDLNSSVTTVTELINRMTQ